MISRVCRTDDCDKGQIGHMARGGAAIHRRAGLGDPWHDSGEMRFTYCFSWGTGFEMKGPDSVSANMPLPWLCLPEQSAATGRQG